MSLSALFKNGIQYAAAKRYHYIQLSNANKALAIIEKTNGKTDPRFLKLCDEYAVDVLGNVSYAPWLSVYAAFNADFKEGWIPDNYYREIVIPKIQGEFGKVSNLKYFTNTLFNTQQFPDLIYHVNRRWLTVNGEILSTDQVATYLFTKYDHVLFKQDNSMQGLGIQLFNKKSFQQCDLKNLSNGVFQYFVHQHPFFEEFVQGSVATLRITTTVDEIGKSQVTDTYLRLGLKGERFVASNSQLKVSVHTSGELSEIGYKNGWQPVMEHPDSRVPFKGKKIPCFDAAVALCSKLHAQFPQVECIGWDVAINSTNEINILEWNGYHNDIKFSEATNGPCFKNMGWENIWKT